jgi:SAM-dependent methyltransferase
MLRRMAALAPRLPDPLVWRIHGRSSLRGALYRYVDWKDSARIARSGPIPPAALRFRVHGDLDAESFLETGRQCSDDIRAALGEIARDLGSFERILDFGCGCGRTLQWLGDYARPGSLHGTDIDRDAITWCRASIESAAFSVNGELPPLAYPNDHFDLVYAVSVFTHLAEDRQLAWLKELRRVARPGALVLLTVRGASYAEQLGVNEAKELETRGFAFSQMPPYFQTLFPSWYQTATMTEPYIRGMWSAEFDVLRHLPQALDGCQDVIVLQKS